MSKSRNIRVVSHTTLIGRQNGETVASAPGEPVQLPRAEAEDLIRRGLAERYAPPQSPATASPSEREADEAGGAPDGVDGANEAGSEDGAA